MGVIRGLDRGGYNKTTHRVYGFKFTSVICYRRYKSKATTHIKQDHTSKAHRMNGCDDALEEATMKEPLPDGRGSLH